jgi:hypothetical protein
MIEGGFEGGKVGNREEEDKTKETLVNKSTNGLIKFLLFKNLKIPPLEELEIVFEKKYIKKVGINKEMIDSLNLYRAIEEAKKHLAANRIEYEVDKESGEYFLYGHNFKKNKDSGIGDEFYRERFHLSGEVKILEYVCGTNSNAELRRIKKNYEAVVEFLNPKTDTDRFKEDMAERVRRFTYDPEKDVKYF